MSRSELDEQVKQNFKAFEKMRFDPVHKGRVALLRDGELIEILGSRLDAHKMAEKLYPDKIYSIQEISPTLTDLGWMSYALR